ncbi:MAG TPA: tetratricopeptide repeat protein, partial [Gemmatimonadales bacterium]|nr:tetratricopeptide repeat protein [Gemmatimonadales bacterium]
MSSPATPSRSPAASAGSFIGTFALILAGIAGLFAIDSVLAEHDRAAGRSEARRLYQEGIRLEQQGATVQAVDRLRSAVSAERQNPLYQRALANGLLAMGKITDAETVLTERLQHDPADAGASLLMARALVRQRKLPQAIAFYHRAIYGQWEDRQLGDALEARFELVDLLARENARQELLAELLPLETQAPGDIATRRRIARLFIAAGSPSHAIEIFRDVLHRNPEDGEAYAGIGEAKFQQGNYRSAQANFAAAQKLMPGNREVEARLELCREVLALDPTQRGIGTGEQYRRSQILLQQTMSALDSCATSVPPANQATVDTARAIMSQRRKIS